MTATGPRNQPPPSHTLFLSTNSVSCLGTRNNTPLHLTTQDPSSPQLREEEGILRRGPHLPFCKNFSRSSFRFSPSSWSSTNLRKTANSAWATEREKEHHLVVREAWRQGGHHTGSASPGACWSPFFLLELEAPWSRREHSFRDMFTPLAPAPFPP